MFRRPDEVVQNGQQETEDNVCQDWICEKTRLT